MNFSKSKQIINYLIIFFLRKKITIKKIFNLFFNFFYGLTISNKAAKYPSILVIEPTDLCNLRCRDCGYNLAVEKKRTILKFGDYKKIIDETKDYIFCVLLYFAGEPFLNSEIIEMIDYAEKNNIAVITSTNGNFNFSDEQFENLINSKCSSIIFSVSGATQKIYEKYHISGNLEKVNNNIKKIIKYKKKHNSKFPLITIRYLITNDNLEELESARQFYNNLGIDYFQPRYAYSQSAVNNFIEQKYGNNNTLMQNSKMPKKYKNFCFWLWFILIIKANKTILPCCYEFFKIPVLGDYNNQNNIADIWNSEKYRNFRESVLKYREIMNCCKNCDSSFGFQDNVLLKK